MTRSKKGLLIVFSTFVIASAGAVAANASNPTTTPPRQATPAEIEESERSVQTIGTKFGEFERSDQDLNVPAEQTVTDLILVNSNTVKIVTKYGIFIKK